MNELRSLIVFLFRVASQVLKFTMVLLGGLGLLFVGWMLPLQPLLYLVILLVGVFILGVSIWALLYLGMGYLARLSPSTLFASKFRKRTIQYRMKCIDVMTGRLFNSTFLIEFLKGASFAAVFVLLSYVVPTDQTIGFGGGSDLSAERLILTLGLLFALMGSTVRSKKSE